MVVGKLMMKVTYPTSKFDFKLDKTNILTTTTIIDVYSSYSRKRKQKEHSEDRLSVGSDDLNQRGAGMSYQEIEKRRNIEYTLDDKYKRNIEKLSRPMFGKDDIKMTYIPKTKVRLIKILYTICIEPTPKYDNDEE